MAANYENQTSVTLATTTLLIEKYNEEVEEHDKLSIEPAALEKSIDAFNMLLEKAGLIKFQEQPNQPKNIVVTPVGKLFSYMKSYKFSVTGQIIDIYYWDESEVIPRIIKADK